MGPLTKRAQVGGHFAVLGRATAVHSLSAPLQSSLCIHIPEHVGMRLCVHMHVLHGWVRGSVHLSGG